MWSIYKVSPDCMVGEEIKEGVSNEEIEKRFKEVLSKASSHEWIYAENTDHCVAEQFGDRIEIDHCNCGNCDNYFPQSELEGEK